MRIVTNIIYFRETPNGKEILLQKKNRHPIHGNKWSLFGGQVEKDDKSPKEAIKREIQEELGLKEKAITLFKTFIFDHLQYYVYIAFFNHQILEISLKEGAGFAFLTPEEISNLPLIDADRHIIKEFLQEFSG